MHPRAQQLIERLQLQPHPEGGFYREIYRTELQVHSETVGDQRSALTDIYYLLPAGQVSRWHRVAHPELWNFYEGAPLQLHQFSADLQQKFSLRLDPQVGVYKYLVPAEDWQAAETLGDYTLVGCTVAPGFEERDFHLLKDLPEMAARLRDLYPELARFI